MKIKKLFSKAAALLLSCSMVFGMSGVVYAAEAGDVNDVVEAVKNGDYTEEEILAAIEEAAKYVADNYETAYAEAYKYAADNGYIKATVDGLAEVKAELSKIDVAALDASDEFKAELNEAIDNATETIDELIALINKADALDNDTYQAALVLLEKLEDNLADANDILTIVGSKAADAAWAKYQEVKPVIVEKLEEAVAVGTEMILEAMGEAYDELVAAVVDAAKVYAPEAADYIYNWLYNNPATVIAFFNAYGDDIVSFVEEHQEAIVAVLGYLVSEFGDDVANYVMENPEEVLATLVDLYEKHGENTWALVKVYLDELGITEKLSDPETIKAALAEIQNWLEEYGPLIAEGIYNYAESEGYIAALEEAILELQAEIEATLKAYVNDIKPEIEAKIADLEAQLKALEAELKALEDELCAKKAELEATIEELKEQLKNADAELRAQLEATIEKLEAEIAKIEAAIDAIEEKITEVKAAIEELKAELEEIQEKIEALVKVAEEIKDAVEELIAITKGEVDGSVADVIEQIQAALDKVAEIVDAAEALVDEINAAIDAAQAKVEEIIASVEGLKDAIEAAIEGLEDGIEDAIADLQAKAEEIKNALEGALADFADAVETKVNEVVDAFNAAYVGATTADYTVSADSYYVSIGGSYVKGTGLDADFDETTFGQRVAEALGLKDSQYSELGLDGLRAEDYRYILDANYTADEYAKALIEDVAAVREECVAEIEKADLITVSIGNDNFTTFVAAQLEKVLTDGTPYEMDWNNLVGTEGAALVDNALAEVEAYFAESGMGDYAEMLTLLVETYAYGYVGYALNHAEAINAIRAINPDAQIIVLGMYNPLDKVVIDIEGTEIALGEYVNYFVDLADLRFTTYAMLTPNTIFVEIPDTTTFFDENVEGDTVGIEALIALYLENEVMLPSSAGHEYIKDQILGALNVTVEESGLLGDADDDGDVDVFDARLILRYTVEDEDAIATINLVNADYNCDGTVNVFDARAILQYVVNN